MRKGRDGEEEQKNRTEENNDGNSGPLTSLPVGLPKVDRLQRRRSCQLPFMLFLMNNEINLIFRRDDISIIHVCLCIVYGSLKSFIIVQGVPKNCITKFVKQKSLIYFSKCKFIKLEIYKQYLSGKTP